MKKFKQIFTVSWIKFLTALLGVFGISACIGEGKELYGSPHAEYKFLGTVQNTDGEKLSNIKVEIKAVYSNQPDGTELISKIFTDTEGRYGILSSDRSYGQYFRIKCSDDSSVYLEDSTDFHVDLKGGDGDWFQGKAEKEVNFTLKKRKPEE
jgi:putative lipoprotein (rSAM/lipoprotein system)